MEITTPFLSLVFRVIGLLAFFVVLYFALSRHLTHYIAWLAVAGIFFLSGFVVGGAARQGFVPAVEWGDSVNLVLSFMGFFVMMAVVMTMWRDEHPPLER